MNISKEACYAFLSYLRNANKSLVVTTGHGGDEWDEEVSWEVENSNYVLHWGRVFGELPKTRYPYVWADAHVRSRLDDCCVQNGLPGRSGIVISPGLPPEVFTVVINVLYEHDGPGGVIHGVLQEIAKDNEYLCRELQKMEFPFYA